MSNQNIITDSSLGQPTVIFEQAHDVSGIAGRYNFPQELGLDRLSLQNRIFERSGLGLLGHDELTKLWERLEQLNPEQIARMDFNRRATDQMRDAVHGMVSGFNPDDINLFMKRAHGPVPLGTVLHMPDEIARKAFEVKIMQRLKKDVPMGWVASETTMEKIWEQMKDRPVINSLERAVETVKNNPAGWIIGGALMAAGGYMLWQQKVNREKDTVMKEVEKKVAAEDCAPCHAAAYLAEKQGLGAREK